MGDRILGIDGQDFTQKTLAQATLAMSATIPLMRLTVARESMEGVCVCVCVCVCVTLTHPTNFSKITILDRTSV